MFPAREVGPGEEPAIALIEIAGAPVGLEREHVGRVVRIGKRQLTQLRNRRGAEQSDAGKRNAGIATDISGDSEYRFLVGKKVESGERHPQRGDGGERKTGNGDAGHFDMHAPRDGAAQAREPSPPAARAPRDEARARQDQHQHRSGTRRHGDPAGIVQEQGAVKIGQPAFNCVGISRRDPLARRGIDDGGSRRPIRRTSRR